MPTPMKELKQQLVSALLVIVTVAAVIAAAINFQQQSRFHLPDDGVTWLDRPSDGNGCTWSRRCVRRGVRARRPASIKATFWFRSTACGFRIRCSTRRGSGAAGRVAKGRVQDSARRASKSSGQRHHRRSRARFHASYYQYAVGAVYLAIGLFVYFRRGSAPRSLHFFLLCLASFVISTFHYSGKLNAFDKVIYLGNVVAGYFGAHAVPAFLLRLSGAAEMDPHGAARRCCCICPGSRCWRSIWVHVRAWLITPLRCSKCRWLLDRVWLVFLCAMYLAGGVVLALATSPRGRSHRPPPVDLAAQRRADRHAAVHAVLRGPLPARRGARTTR